MNSQKIGGYVEIESAIKPGEWQDFGWYLTLEGARDEAEGAPVRWAATEAR